MKCNFLFQITAASRTRDYGGYRPQIPVPSVLCPQLNLLKSPLPENFPGTPLHEIRLHNSRFERFYKI
jgi:hypothetical protein